MRKTKAHRPPPAWDRKHAFSTKRVSAMSKVMRLVRNATYAAGVSGIRDFSPGGTLALADAEKEVEGFLRELKAVMHVAKVTAARGTGAQVSAQVKKTGRVAVARVPAGYVVQHKTLTSGRNILVVTGPGGTTFRSMKKAREYAAAQGDEEVEVAVEVEEEPVKQEPAHFTEAN